MRIGMVLSKHFPPDIRVEKELSTLLQEHEVYLLCPRRGGGPAMEEWNGLKIHRVFSSGERWWSNWRLMRTCHSRQWESKIDQYIMSDRLEVLHVHDLPLLGAALASGRKHGIPVVADLHENYPAMLEDNAKVPLWKCSSVGSLISRLSVSVDRWKAYELATLPQADAVITVIEEARDRLARVGIRPSMLHVVPNYDIHDGAARVSAHIPRVNDQVGTFRAIYAGGFDETRDLHTLVKAVARLERHEFPKLEVVIVGGVGRALTELKTFSLEQGVSDRIRIIEWVAREEAERLMDGAHVGIVPHIRSAHTDTTIPHKLFQYMARRLPVIVSDCAPLARIVASSECGLVYRSGDSDSLAGCIATLYRNPAEALRMGDSGFFAVQKEHNWTRAGENLLAVYRGLVAAARRTSI